MTSIRVLATSAMALTLSLSAASIHAATVEVRSIVLSGEKLSNDEIISLLEGGHLAGGQVLEAQTKSDGAFNTQRTKTVEFATEFTPDGKTQATSTKRVGQILEGKLVPKADAPGLELELRFEDTRKVGDVIYRSDSGAPVPQPVFSTTRQHTSISVASGRWKILTLPSEAASKNASTRRYLAILVRGP